MGVIVHARMDEKTRKILERLRRRTGWNDSEIIRRGVRAIASLVLVPASRTIIGIGKFESGIPDLGSSKKHLDGFGRS